MLGEYLKKLREQNGMTQDELSERIGVTRQSVSKWENGKTLPDIENIKHMSEIYGVTVDNIVYAGVDSETGLEKKEKNKIFPMARKGKVIENEWLGWLMLSIAISSCVIPVFGFVLTMVFFFFSRRIEQRYLRRILQITCVLVWGFCASNCVLLFEVLKKHWDIYMKTGIWFKL